MSIHPTSFAQPVLILSERDRVKDTPKPISKSILIQRELRRKRIATRRVLSSR